MACRHTPYTSSRLGQTGAVLDQGRWRRGGGDPYDAAGRRAVLTVALAAGLLLVLLALRVGYLAAQTLGWPRWPFAIGCAAVALAIPAVAVWVLTRGR